MQYNYTYTTNGNLETIARRLRYGCGRGAAVWMVALGGGTVLLLRPSVSQGGIDELVHAMW